MPTNEKLLEMLVLAYEEIKSENMCCPWCSGRIAVDKEQHDQFCPWKYCPHCKSWAIFLEDKSTLWNVAIENATERSRLFGNPETSRHPSEVCDVTKCCRCKRIISFRRLDMGGGDETDVTLSQAPAEESKKNVAQYLKDLESQVACLTRERDMYKASSDLLVGNNKALKAQLKVTQEACEIFERNSADVTKVWEENLALRNWRKSNVDRNPGQSSSQPG